MVRETGGKLFVVHMALGEGVELIRAARDEDLNVFTETCTPMVYLELSHG